MTIKCIIVDDEPLAREGMEKLVKDAGVFNLVAICNNALEASTLCSWIFRCRVCAVLTS